MNRKDNQHILARAAIVLLVAMLSVVTARAEVVSIGTVAEWNDFAARVNGGETTLGGLLTTDLDFSDQTFTVAGTSTHPYCGTFDGASHTITGISVSKSGDADGSRLGLFGSVGTGGTVRNVTVAGSSFAGWNYVGGIVGYNQGGMVCNCHVTSTVTIGTTAGSKENHGGIVGYNSSIYSTVSHCTSGAIVTNSGQAACHYFGGIVGNNSGGTVEYCLAVGATVSAATNSGAIAGSNAGTLSYNYYANCRVGETTSNIGIGSGDVSTNDGALPAILLYDQGTEAAGNTTTISGNSGSEKNVVLYGRTLQKTGDWNTLCLPFALSDAQIATSPLAGATIKELDTAADGTCLDEGTLTLKFKDAASIVAGKPYIVKWTSGDNIVNPVFHGVTITSTTPSNVVSNDGKVTFVGQYSPFKVGNTSSGDDGNLNEIILLSTGNKLGYATSARTLKSFRCHFYVSASAAVRNFEFDFGDFDSADGIENVNVNDNVNDNAIYNLAGQKLSRPQKGINIVNGRKVLF
jgi:hypothetical protein